MKILHRWFYLVLALAFSGLVVIDLSYWHLASEMRQAAFGLIVRNRIAPPAPDPSIVILDIDEESLSAMAPEYGRWPWPRQVFGEFLEHLDRQKPRAVVFDMLFSDPDVFHAESDSYFASVVAATDNTFFPILRLGEATDSMSFITPAMIPGVRPLRPAADTAATIGVALPSFDAILATARLGINNIYPDPDGVAREYIVYRDEAGWRLPSLPARVAEVLGRPVPERERILLNWRGPPFTYPTTSFARVYNDMLKEDPTRPSNEFTGKIVVIGSTAASLFDQKPTPISRIHPGVEILATAIDNLLNGDHLLLLAGSSFHLTVSLILLWSTAIAFHRNTGRDRIDSFFSASGILLALISFASLNLTRLYIDLTGPVTVGLAYFTVARLYSATAGRERTKAALGHRHEGEGGLRAVLALIEATRGKHEIARLVNRLRGALSDARREDVSVEVMKGEQEGIWSSLEGMIVVTWTVAAEDDAGHDRVMKEVESVRAMAKDEGRVTVHEGILDRGTDLRGQWRGLFAGTILKSGASKGEAT